MSVYCLCGKLSTLESLICFILVTAGIYSSQMTIYWVTEAIPLPITGMIPMVAFPCKMSSTKSFNLLISL